MSKQKNALGSPENNKNSIEIFIKRKLFYDIVSKILQNWYIPSWFQYYRHS